MSKISLSDRDEAIFDALLHYNLRFPGVVSPRVQKILKMNWVSAGHIAVARLEWISLGLDKSLHGKFGSAGERL